MTSTQRYKAENAHRPSMRHTLAESALTVVLCSAVALAFNALRTNSLPLVPHTPYQTLVPCPEPGGPVQAFSPDDPGIGAKRTFLVDARSRAEHDLEHLPDSFNLPFDWLDPVPDDDLQKLAELIASSRATRVMVYGDGGRPDSGEHLGKEISGRGIKNVGFVEGGAPALFDGEPP